MCASIPRIDYDDDDDEKLLKLRKTNKNGLKTLSFNDKDKIKGKVNSTWIDILV